MLHLVNALKHDLVVTVSTIMSDCKALLPLKHHGTLKSRLMYCHLFRSTFTFGLKHEIKKKP